jgi:hypothetical protein
VQWGHGNFPSASLTGITVFLAPVPAAWARSTGQNSSAALRSNNVGRLLTILENGVGLHERTRSVGRGNTGLGHDATGGHGAQNRRSATTRRRGSNGLRVRDRSGSLRHHTSRGSIALVRIRVLGHGVDARTVTRL